LSSMSSSWFSEELTSKSLHRTCYCSHCAITWPKKVRLCTGPECLSVGLLLLNSTLTVQNTRFFQVISNSGTIMIPFGIVSPLTQRMHLYKHHKDIILSSTKRKPRIKDEV